MDMLELYENRLVVRLPAELDHHSTEEIRRKIDDMIRDKIVDELEFDFSQTVFMDSAGIGMLLGRYKMMRALNGQILISHMNGQVQRLLQLSGIRKYIQF